MAIFGIIFVVILGLCKRKAFSLRKRDVLRIVAWALFGALVGARLFSVIGKMIQHSGEPGFWTVERWTQILLNSGLVFYGGLIGAVGAAMLRAKIGHIDLKSVFNFAAYTVFAFLPFGRAGCYCAGCCYGIELAGGTNFPVQLVEAGYCFLMLLVFLIMRPERRWPGVPLFPVTIIIYSVGRFILEFLRGDANRGHLWVFSTSQWIAFALIALAVVWLIKNKNTQNREDLSCESNH
ncbi:MAG: prolipoprotein diacylglyceryl transferase [Oscillospiraceae bacterium]|nr:prolipoprotein diacylglyceryl transferase [Oscillospiraceae bacterium]